MHGAALAWTQRWTIGGRARSRALKNWLSWHRTSWRRTHGGSRGRSGGSCRCGGPQGRLIYRTRTRLRNDHSRRRRCRGHRCARGGWPGSHGRRLCWWHRGPRRRCRRRRAAGRNRRRRRWNCRSGRGWRRGRCRLRWSRHWSGKAWPRCRSRNHQFRRSSRRRSGCLGGGSRGRRRRGRDCGLCGRRCNDRSLRGRGRLLLADDGF